jgi:D-alanyl-D-alanine carboxypeptidase (penicillin-binding protein 5/6)
VILNKRIKSLSILLIVLLLFISNGSAIAYDNTPFDIEAKSAILIDASTGEILYEKNVHERLSPASITKIMVLLLTMEALENGKITLQDEMIISSNAAGMGGSQIYLEEGEIQKVEEIIKAVCLRSANDGAVALAEHIAGSEEIFVKMMNDKAKALGMKNTNFMNVTGLDEEGHYTSAYDIALMSRELLKYPKIHEWLTLWMAEIKVGKEKDVIQGLVNTNRLIHDYKGANGIKTGYTSKAGHCLAASATRGNLTLISVVLGCNSSTIRFKESRKLLDYGFANYDSVPIAKKGEIIGKLKVSKGKARFIDVCVEENTSILVKKGLSNEIDKEVILPKYITAPIKEGQKVGEMLVKANDKEIKKVDIVAKSSVERASIFDIFKRMLNSILGK